MKKLTTSFLFFYCCTIFFFVITHAVKAQQLKDSTNYYYNIVVNSQSNDSLLFGYVFFRNQKEKNLKNNNHTEAIYNLRLLIIAQQGLGLIYEAESSIIEALQLIDNESTSTHSFIQDKVALYNSLGMVYRLMDEYDKAIAIYNKALGIAERTADRIHIHSNKASVYKDQGNFKLAEQQYNTTYNERLKTNDKLFIAQALDNLGSTQGKQGKESGLKKMLEALAIRIKINDVQHYYTSYKHLTEYYKDKGDIKKAKEYAKLGYEAAKLYRAPYLEDALPRLLELSDDQLVLEYVKMNDSLLKTKFLTDKKYSSSKYNLAKEQQRTLESELKNEKQKKLNLIYLFLALSILFVSLFLFIILRSRHKKEKVHQVYKTEIRISKKVHDEVANDLYHVMTKLQSKNDSNEDVLDDLEGIYNKTRDISKENSTIDINENYNELLNDLLLSYKNNEINVITQNISKIDWDTVSDLKKTTLYRVLQELMTNMRKHSKASIVLISFNKTKNKIVIDYKDNGIGCDLVKNNGLLNAENRMVSINGTITFESQTNNSFNAKIIV